MTTKLTLNQREVRRLRADARKLETMPPKSAVTACPTVAGVDIPLPSGTGGDCSNAGVDSGRRLALAPGAVSNPKRNPRRCGIGKALRTIGGGP